MEHGNGIECVYFCDGCCIILNSTTRRYCDVFKIRKLKKRRKAQKCCRRELIEKLRQKGINIAFVTLHVSYGTFKPVEVKSIDEHKVDPEYFTVPEKTPKLIRLTKEEKNRVVAVGTTVARALETKPFELFSGYTDLYIYPGFEFKVVDALITNFHLPICFFSFSLCRKRKGFVMQVYQEAIQKRYRFYSYGDGMLIL